MTATAGATGRAGRLCPVCNRVKPYTHFYPRSGKPRCTPRLRWTQARRFRLMTLIDQGLSNAQIATRMGTTEAAVHLARKRYKIGGVYRHALSARAVADMMGIGCAKTVTKWIERGFLAGKRIRKMGPHHTWLIQRSDLWGFVEDERTWHLWQIDRIADHDLRTHAERVRGDVRFLTPGEVADRLYTMHSTVNQWINKGWLPARRWGNWWIDERDLARFELPQIGGGRYRKDRAA